MRAFLCLLLLSCPVLAQQPLPRLTVRPGSHFVETADGKPFFWLGDTDWELLHRLDRDEVDDFLDIRQAQGFTVLQAVALAEFEGITTPNAYGDLPLTDLDPARPATTPGSDPADNQQYDYWDHVDYVIQQSAKRGIYVALLPTWGDKVTREWGAGPVVFNEQNANSYGRWLGQRYASQTNVIWMLGGDRPASLTDAEATRRKRAPFDHRPIWRSMAAGIRVGVGAGVPLLMTYHTSGGAYRTADEMHDEPWLMMNSMQSGHGGGHDVPVWNWVEADWNRTPVKPTLDLEPNYDDHPVNPWPKWDPKNGYFSAHDVRKQTWRSVMAGGAGVTYGHHFIWQFYDPKRPPVNNGDTLIHWRQAARTVAAGQMQHLRHLIESRPQLDRMPDQSLLASPNGTGGEHVRACRSRDGRYAFVYLPQNRPVGIDLRQLPAQQLVAHWYDPRTGRATRIGTFKGNTTRVFAPPTASGVPLQTDWVLVLDDASQRFGVPGQVD
jgi:hypothetical protein